MLKFFLVAHLTYENQWVKLHNKKNIFGFFGTPYSAPVNTKEEALLCVSTDSVFAAQCSQGLPRRRYDQGSLRK